MWSWDRQLCRKKGTIFRNDGIKILLMAAGRRKRGYATNTLTALTSLVSPYNTCYTAHDIAVHTYNIYRTAIVRG
jgi:hypothetical protein